MKGKYRNPLVYALVKAQRALLRRRIAPLITWEPLHDPKPGYSVLIGTSTPLLGMLGANLAMLAKQDLSDCDRIYIVVDQPRDWLPRDIEAEMQARFTGLPLEFIYHTPRQADVLGRIGWGWTYAWANWSMALGRCRTKHAILHDFDALLLSHDLLARRVRMAQERGAAFFGVKWYKGNGVEPSDKLVTTFELVFDAQLVREQFVPLDVFNHVCVHHGRSVDFDTFLYLQSRTDAHRDAEPIAEADMVHPSQMICQFTYLMNRGGYVPPRASNLLMIPYFMHLAGETDALATQREALAQSDGRQVVTFGKAMDLEHLTADHAAWLQKQAARVESALFGQVRPEVQAYFDQMAKLAR